MRRSAIESFSLRCSSSTERTRPESRSSDHFRAQTTAISICWSTRLSVESPYNQSNGR
jgi:hypothetical protein